jgi:Dolichyl-phosphate-mannose-protein mannosyltransferase
VGRRPVLSALLAAGLLLASVAWLRGAEYDEQYTLFLTGRAARPVWPVGVITAGEVRDLQAAGAGFAAIARDLRSTDVHPPLYFWAVAAWRRLVGSSLFAARLASVLFSVVTLGLVAVIARSAGIPLAPAVLLTAGCYGFAYTAAVARGFALAQLLSVAGVALLLGPERRAARALAAGMLLGAATFANYLAAFVACAALLHTVIARPTVIPAQAGTRGEVGAVALGPRVRGDDNGGQATKRSAPACPTVIPAQAGTRGEVRAVALGPRVRGDDNGEQATKRSAPACRTVIPAQAGTRGEVGAVALSPRVRGDDSWGRSAAGAAIIGFAVWLPADLWFFLAQRDSRAGQFAPFEPVSALTRLGQFAAANVFGGLPLYVDGAARTSVTIALCLVLFGMLALIVRRWRHIATPATRLLLGMAAAAPPIGLCLLGMVFGNTPIELRYLAFATPFLGLLLAAALPRNLRYAVLAIQAVAVLGLMFRPETMQPARATAMAAARLVGDGVVLLPHGNDGVGIVGAFAIEAPPTLRLLVIASASPAEIRARASVYPRAVLALLSQDAASRATLPVMRQAFTDPCWRPAGEGFNALAFDRTCEAECACPPGASRSPEPRQ